MGGSPPDIPKQSAMVSMMLFRCNSPTPGLRYFRRERKTNNQKINKQARSKDQTVAI
ncbi:hypothetical protein ACRRTK_023774 [Alexandromys fortis]